MTLKPLQFLDVIEGLENFIDEIRPPAEVRSKLDISYKIENQSVMIIEIRPLWNAPDQKKESAIAKATYVKAKNHWKVYWKRSDLKWHSYEPQPIAKTIKEFVKLVREDKHHCFWG